MPLQDADWHDILKVLHETVRIWSAGLSFADYCQFLGMQMAHPWFRRNCRVLVYKNGSQVLGGCKLYSLKYVARGRSYSFRGLGAVYTLTSQRQKGNAAALIEEVIESAAKEGLDGIVLYSEIGDEFYESFGFEPLGSAEFEISLEGIPNALATLETFVPKVSGVFVDPEQLGVTSVPTALAGKEDADRVDPLEHGSEHIKVLKVWNASSLNAHFLHGPYTKWLRRQPFGVERSPSYFDYKITKENFLLRNSRLPWPQLTINELEMDGRVRGYALTECSTENMRILEIVGDEEAGTELWNHLIRQCFTRKLKRLRGWEAVIRELAPTFKLPPTPQDVASLLPNNIPLLCLERHWGRCMILFLNQDLRSWLEINPCPMLELDHL